MPVDQLLLVDSVSKIIRGAHSCGELDSFYYKLVSDTLLLNIISSIFQFAEVGPNEQVGVGQLSINQKMKLLSLNALSDLCTATPELKISEGVFLTDQFGVLKQLDFLFCSFVHLIQG